MSPDYQRLRQQADQLYYRFNDIVDDKAAAGTLPGNVRNVVEEFEMNKNPHDIEARVKEIIEALKAAGRDETQIMDRGHGDELVSDYEKLREQIRELPNY